MIKNADILDSLNNLFGAQRISKGQEQITQKLSPIVQSIKEKGLVQPWGKAIPKLPVDQWKSTISDSYGKFNRAATYMLLSGLVGGALGYGAHRLNNRRLKRFKKDLALNLGQKLFSIYGFGALGALTGYGLYKALNKKGSADMCNRVSYREAYNLVKNSRTVSNNLNLIGQSWEEDRDYNKKFKEWNKNKSLEKKQYLQSLQEQNQANTFHQITNNSKQNIQKLTQMPRAVENKKQGQTKVTVQTPPGTPAQQFTKVN